MKKINIQRTVWIALLCGETLTPDIARKKCKTGRLASYVYRLRKQKGVNVSDLRESRTKCSEYWIYASERRKHIHLLNELLEKAKVAA